MSTSTESCNDLEMADPEGRENVYSSASSYSTYSREVKYIFNPADDSTDEYGDYSHITPRSKQNYMSHTPSVLSAASQVSGKENRTPHVIRDDHLFEHAPQMVSLRTGSVLSSASRDRGPISPHLEEALYSSSYYGCDARNQAASSDYGPRDRTYFSPGNDHSPHMYTKQAVQVWKNSNILLPLHSQSLQKLSNSHDMNKHKRNNGPVLNTFQTQHPLTSVHSSIHYQHPNTHHSVDDQPSYQQQNHSYVGHEPAYPNPPRYSHQHHARRKTWSPPALKISLLNASVQGSRVCYSNDSLDTAEEAGMERRTQSLSEDLDVTPPKLTPFSGVLAHVSNNFKTLPSCLILGSV